MLRFLLILILFIGSLVVVFPVPSKHVWYWGIAIPEYPWIFMLTSLALGIWTILLRSKARLRIPSIFLAAGCLCLTTYPVISAYSVGHQLELDLKQQFTSTALSNNFGRKVPFSFLRMFTGKGYVELPFTAYTYASPGGLDLTLHFTTALNAAGPRPCLIVVHGGSWKSGDNSEIAHFNQYMANAGYHVATINYRLAPQYTSPAQRNDIHAAFQYLRSHSVPLHIDTSRFLLLGRSAGAQLVLSAAYSNTEPGLRGVVSFYGPTDMFWTWQHPDNPLIMDSRQVQKDFLGGGPAEVPGRFAAESAMLHLSPASTPTLLVHGENDAHVYYEQSVRLHKALDSLHVPNVLLGLPWATHGADYHINGPSGQLSTFAIERFFQAVCR